MKTRVVTQAAALRALCAQARKDNKRVALVPTMGALHAGHLSLVDLAQAKSDFQVVTIFVNPIQFGQGEDFEKYPRVLATDQDQLAISDVDIIFAPSKLEIYPQGFSTAVTVSGISEGLCGGSRPGHFSGVATVVTKLFNIVGPCVAVFGRKDYQQLQVIKQLVRDLNLPVEIAEAPIVREPDGVAMSSRNAYLSKPDRTRARALSKGLKAAHALFEAGERRVGALLSAVRSPLENAVDEMDYVTAADPDTLAVFEDNRIARERLLIAVAVRIGATRLIDNTVLGEDRPPF